MPREGAVNTDQEEVIIGTVDQFDVQNHQTVMFRNTQDSMQTFYLGNCRKQYMDPSPLLAPCLRGTICGTEPW